MSVAGCLIVAGALAIALAESKDEFVSALGSAPFWVLGIAVALHIVWLLARSEAWSVCIRAALLTVTAAVGAVLFATWALADLLWRRPPAPAAATA